jgi:two-component system, LytTR family, sensor kinase
MAMMKKTQLYWFCQVFGWSFYIMVNSLFFGLSREPGLREFMVYFFMLPAGIGITHAYRLVILRINILTGKIPAQLLFIIGSSFLLAGLFFLTILLFSALLGLQLGRLEPMYITESVLNFTSIFWLWSVIYFAFQYFQNYKRSEINALRYLAASRQSELENLRAQLNPHFIFNCLNSIRALIDESPTSAKKAVTTLSSILRNTLVSGRSREITIADELSLVEDYLALEKIRYEERLEFRIEISAELRQMLIPPFLIQSQVENAIKHGLSQHPGKCEIEITGSESQGKLHISVSNTGALKSDKPETGIGLSNSAQRLSLLYGPEASIRLDAVQGRVIVMIEIPSERTRKQDTNETLAQLHESNNN